METKKNIGEAKIVGQPKAPFRFKLKDGCVKSNHLAEESVTTGNIQNAAVSTEKIMDEAVTNAKIMNGAITNSKISNGTITNEKIANNSIDNSKIQNLTLTGDKFTDNSIDGSKIKDNSVPGSKLADGAIESIDLQDNTLSGSKLADNSVDGGKLVDGAVASEKLKDNSIDGSKIADGTIQSLDIKDGSISGSKLVDNSIPGTKLSDGIITNNKIADNSITGDKFLDESISGEKIASNTIHGRKLEDNTVDGADIIEGTLNGSKIADMSIDGDKLADDSIETRHIKSNTISGSKIVTNSIDSTKIRNNSLIGDNIATGTLTGDKFVDNTITGDKIIDNTLPGSKIKDGTIESVDIKDNTLSGTKLIDNSISGSKIADNAITSSHLLDNSIPASKILDGTIESIDIKDGTLDGSKVKDNTITGAKLADNVITSAKLSDNSVTTDKIVNLAVTEGKIATDAVTSEKISNGSVTETKLGTGAVTTNKIVDNSVTTAKIADSAVTEDKLTDGSITMAKLADDTISKMETITDVTPTEGSVKPIQSGGVQVALMNRAIVGDIVGDPAQAWEPGTVEAYIDQKIAEQNAVLNAKMSRQDAVIHTLNGQDIVIVSALPQTGETNKIYRLTGTDSYTDYMWDTSLATPAFTDIAIYSFPGIDDEPTANSQKLVKSGGIYSELALGAVYDISAHHNNTSYTDLAAALGTNGNNIPQGLRKGGMSVKFVQSSDNKYVQFRYMPSDASTAATFTNVANWQGVDSEPVAESRNLVESGGAEKLNHPYIDPVVVQTGEELTTIGTRDSTKVTLTKDGGEFTIVKTVTEFTGGLGYYIGLLDYDYTKKHFLYVDYEYTKKGSTTANIDVRVNNTGTNDALCARYQMEVGAHSAKIALSKTLQGKYITCNFNDLGSNGTTVVLRNIRIVKEDDTTIKEKFDRIDEDINEISDRTYNNYEDVKGHIAAISDSLYEKISLTSYTYAINIDGKYGTSTSYKHQALPVVAGEQYYIHIAPRSVFRYAFATDHAYSAGADISLVENTEVVWYGAENEDKKELLITIPESCNFLLFFYASFVYKITPSRVDEICKKVDDNSDDIKVLGETCAYREWQALSMYNNYKFKLTINGSIATVDSGTSNNQTLAFIPVKKDDVYRFTVENTNVSNYLIVVLFDEPPVSAGIEGEVLYYDYYQNGVMEAIVKMPKDGFLARYVYLQSTSMELYEYKLAENGFCEDVYVKKEQAISYTDDSLIVIDPKSANFGEVLIDVTNNNYKTSDFIPVDDTKYIKTFSRKSGAGFAITSYLNNTFGCLFYDEDKEPIAWSGIPVEVYTVGVVKNQGYAIHAVPANAAYIRVTEYKENVTVYFLKEKISELNFKEAKDYTGLLAQAKFVTSSPTIQSLGLVHFSDIHGDQTSADAIRKFISDYSQYITDVLCTGDSVHYYADPTSTYPQGSAWWKETSKLANISMFTLGNHDSATTDSTEYDQIEDSAAWDGKGKDWCFETYIEPYISQLGYVMPTGYDDPTSPNYHACFWHKDYAAQKIRLIGLDCMHRFDGIVNPATGEITSAGLKYTTNEQELWLIAKLNETLTGSGNAAEGYSVVVCCHYPLDDFSGNNEAWDDTTHKFIYNQGENGGRVMSYKTGGSINFHYELVNSYTAVVKFNMRNRVDNGYSESQPYPNYTKGSTNNIGEILKAWKNNGGKFVVWLCGHTHVDYMWYSTNYPDMLCMVLDQAGNLRGTNTGSRPTTLDSRTCANYIAIDTQNGLLKVVRIGYQMNKLMNSHKYMCYDYINKKVLNEG